MHQSIAEDEVIRTISPDDKMFAGDANHYFGVGRSALACIDTCLQAARKPVSAVNRILDLPCGHGRVLRYLQRAFPEAELTACDLLRDGVDFCAGTFGATPVYSEEDPGKIPLPHDHFDLIWIGSLFTHLDADLWNHFLAALRSFLRPGGVLVFTTQGRKAHQRLTALEYDYEISYWKRTALLYHYERQGFGYINYRAKGQRYGVTFSRPDWVFEQVAKVGELRVVHFSEASWDDHQDCFACVREPGWAREHSRIPSAVYLRHQLLRALWPWISPLTWRLRRRLGSYGFK